VSSEYHDAKRCKDCMDTGTVAIYAHRSVKAVELGKTIKFAYSSAVICHCAVATKRYGKVLVDDQPPCSFTEYDFCRMPSHYHRPTPDTVEQDVRVMREWLDGRGTARVGEFTAEDWRG
jgi:hypothetical protein